MSSFSLRKWFSIGLLLGLPLVAMPQIALAKDTTAVASAALIDLNSATADQLETLPGIGPAKAKAIVEGRPYKSLKDFESRGIVAASTIDKLKDQVTVAKAAPAAKAPATTTETAAATAQPAGKLDLNTATADELQALPGIGPAKAKAIIDGRPYSSLKDFESRNILAASLAEKFRGQLTVNKAKAKPAASESAAAPDEKIDLNTATVDDLQTLPGIGPAKAKAIVEGRPYSSIKDFESRNIVSAFNAEKYKGQVMVSKVRAKPAVADTPEEKNPPEPLGKIDLNTATAEELEVLPGVGPVRAKAIIDGRPYASLAQFESKGIIPAGVFDKFKGATEVSGSTAKAASSQGTAGQIAAQKRIKMCGAKWRAAKSADRIPAGMSWPQYWSQCNTALKERGY